VPSAENSGGAGAGFAVDTGHQGGTGAVACPVVCANILHHKGDVYYTCKWGSFGPASSPFVEYIPHTEDLVNCSSGIPLDVVPRHRLFVHGLHSNVDAWNLWYDRVVDQMDYLGYKTVRDNTGQTDDFGPGSNSLMAQVTELALQVNAGFPGVPDASVEVYAHSMGALKMEALLQLGYQDGAKCNWSANCASTYFKAARKIGRVYVFQGAHGGCGATYANGDFPNHGASLSHGILPGCPASRDIGWVRDGSLIIPGTPYGWDMNLIVWRGRTGQEKHFHYVVAHSNGGTPCKGEVGFICKTPSNDGVVNAWQMVPTWYPHYGDAHNAGYVDSSPGNAEPGNYCHMLLGNDVFGQDKEDSYLPPRLSEDLMNRYVGIKPNQKYLVPTGRVAYTYEKDVIDCPDSCFCGTDFVGACRNRIDCRPYGGVNCNLPPTGGGTPGTPGGVIFNPAGQTTVFRQSSPTPAGRWTTCASEGGTCAFTGAHVVRYGAQNIYVTQTLTNGTRCTSEVFGDPVPGVTKTCDYQ